MIFPWLTFEALPLDYFQVHFDFLWFRNKKQSQKIPRIDPLTKKIIIYISLDHAVSQIYSLNFFLILGNNPNQIKKTKHCYMLRGQPFKSNIIRLCSYDVSPQKKKEKGLSQYLSQLKPHSHIRKEISIFSPPQPSYGKCLIKWFKPKCMHSVVSQLVYAFLSLCYIFPFSFIA